MDYPSIIALDIEPIKMVWSYQLYGYTALCAFDSLPCVNGGKMRLLVRWRASGSSRKRAFWLRRPKERLGWTGLRRDQCAYQLPLPVKLQRFSQHKHA